MADIQQLIEDVWTAQSYVEAESIFAFNEDRRRELERIMDSLSEVVDILNRISVGAKPIPS